MVRMRLYVCRCQQGPAATTRAAFQELKKAHDKYSKVRHETACVICVTGAQSYEAKLANYHKLSSKLKTLKKKIQLLQSEEEKHKR